MGLITALHQIDLPIIWWSICTHTSSSIILPHCRQHRLTDIPCAMCGRPQGAMSTHMCSLGCLHKGQTFINPSATPSTPLLDELSLDAHQKLINSLNPLQGITHWAFSTHRAQTPYGKWKKIDWILLIPLWKRSTLLQIKYFKIIY